MLIVYELTLFVCVRRWSCDLSHGNKWHFRWCWWGI